MMTVSPRRTWKERAQRLKRDLYALMLAYKDQRVPWYARIFIISLLGYAFSPIDLIPDFVPVLGYLDDLVLLPLGILLAIKLIPPAVLEESRAQAQSLLSEAKPANWLGALAIALIWLSASILIVWLVVRWIWQ
jgi:uncharacterized membrane protein YkvA (DUF1232 family)